MPVLLARNVKSRLHYESLVHSFLVRFVFGSEELTNEPAGGMMVVGGLGWEGGAGVQLQVLEVVGKVEAADPLRS